MGALRLLPYRLATGLLCIAAISFAPIALGQPASSSHKRILVLHFARPDAGAFAGIEAAIHNTLADDFGDRLEYTSEYLDLIRFAEPRFQSAMRAYLRVRNANVRFDAIIAASPAVFQFLEEDPSLRSCPCRSGCWSAARMTIAATTRPHPLRCATWRRGVSSASAIDVTAAFYIHFTPTSASWLNLVERWFALLTQKQIKRGAHRSTRELERRSVST